MTDMSFEVFARRRWLKVTSKEADRKRGAPTVCHLGGAAEVRLAYSGECLVLVVRLRSWRNILPGATKEAII
ncbi:hypothetical protein EVAR_32765_1 [Eumeta japonica]|uniref:Uncharacterized protein n=1 Tax=Eumeta variegata TaxID=151549 RepID=A0A4C1WF43_EUMVA|nr:hypothetical protein EVAR_32765_1 [Eumeta japonica]